MKSIVILCPFLFAVAIAAGGNEGSSSSGDVVIDIDKLIAQIAEKKKKEEWIRGLFQQYTQDTGGVLTAESAQNFVLNEGGKEATHEEALGSVRKMAKNKKATYATESQFVAYMTALRNKH